MLWFTLHGLTLDRQLPEPVHLGLYDGDNRLARLTFDTKADAGFWLAELVLAGGSNVEGTGPIWRVEFNGWDIELIGSPR
jgi:hypothetical protein